MNAAVARLALRPTAAALPWAPVLAVAVGLLLVGWLSATTSGGRATPTTIVCGLLAASAVAALEDRSEAVLAALPTSRLWRRLLRLALVAGVVVPTLVLLAAVAPGARAAAPTLALILAGLAVACWAPLAPGARIAAATCASWALAPAVVPESSGLPADLASSWIDHPWLVALLSVGVIIAGRHR